MPSVVASIHARSEERVYMSVLVVSHGTTHLEPGLEVPATPSSFRAQSSGSTAHSVVDYVCVYASSKAQNRIEYESFEPIGVVRTVFIISILVHKHTIEISGRRV